MHVHTHTCTCMRIYIHIYLYKRLMYWPWKRGMAKPSFFCSMLCILRSGSARTVPKTSVSPKPSTCAPVHHTQNHKLTQTRTHTHTHTRARAQSQYLQAQGRHCRGTPDARSPCETWSRGPFFLFLEPDTCMRHWSRFICDMHRYSIASIHPPYQPHQVS
jgi:hypothetical protein